MRSVRYIERLVILLVLLWSSTSAASHLRVAALPLNVHAGEPKEAPRLEEANELWHEAGAAETRQDLTRALATYRAIDDLWRGVTGSIGTWYRAVAEFGVARISSRLSDTAATRTGLAACLAHGFWNFPVIARDSRITEVAGSAWVDSMLTRFRAVRQASAAHWPEQPPVTLAPRAIARNSELQKTAANRPPLVIALHGGNASYEEFASHWSGVADSLGVYVVVPPGATRYSAAVNGWEQSFDETSRYVLSEIDTFRNAHGYEPEVYLAGFSQGAETALELGIVHADRIKGVVMLSGFIEKALPHDLLASAAAEGLHVYALSGDLDSRAFRASLKFAAHEAKLAGLPFEVREVPGMVHEVPADLATTMRSIWQWLRPQASTTGGALLGPTPHTPAH